MEKLANILKILKIAVECVLIVLLVIYLKEYRDEALSEMEAE